MLAGYRVLMVEGEPLVAEGLRDLLAEAEGVPVQDGPAVKAALLDENLKDGPMAPVPEALSARGVPTVVYTGASAPEDVRQRDPNLTALAKPMPSARLIGELRKIIDASGPRLVER